MTAGQRPGTVPSMTLEGEYGPSPVDWVREQVEAYEGSGGQEGTTLRETGLPVVIVTMRGKQSGKVRKVPLMRVEDGGEYLLVGSRGGAPTHPLWVHNLRADPDVVMLQDGPDVFDIRVRELDGEERDAWWQRAVAAFPPYADYQAKTDRRIPVFLASRQG
jgi:F420H(2)-dependent quinone reductase